MRYARASVSCGGFSLVEVMVALLVTSVGLLGIAKMQGLALSSTGTARVRSLAALEAASLAAAIRANRGYWGSTTATVKVGTDLTVNIQGPAITSSTDPALKPAGVALPCDKTAACSPTNMAAHDLQDWVTDLSNLIPNVSADIICTMPAPKAPSTESPVSCRIVVNWTESLVAANSQETAVMQIPQYTLYVQP